MLLRLFGTGVILLSDMVISRVIHKEQEITINIVIITYNNHHSPRFWLQSFSSQLQHIDHGHCVQEATSSDPVSCLITGPFFGNHQKNTHVAHIYIVYSLRSSIKWWQLRIPSSLIPRISPLAMVKKTGGHPFNHWPFQVPKLEE